MNNDDKMCKHGFIARLCFEPGCDQEDLRSTPQRLSDAETAHYEQTSTKTEALKGELSQETATVYPPLKMIEMLEQQMAATPPQEERAVIVGELGEGTYIKYTPPQEAQPYNKIDHSHCWTEENPPCGLKGKHRCCLCNEPVPQEVDNHMTIENRTVDNEEPWVAEYTKGWHAEDHNAPKWLLPFIQKTLEADRKERGLRVGNIIKELRDKGLYDDDLYAHFYRIIKGY